MEWIIDNWVWLLFGGAMMAMCLFGHGHGSGHSKGHEHNEGHGHANKRGGGCCGSHGGSHANKAGGKGKSRYIAPEEFVDPVCGKTIFTDDAKPSVHDGQPYYFCSNDCRNIFEASPSDFASQSK
jgi:YHS domain-containing protein